MDRLPHLAGPLRLRVEDLDFGGSTLTLRGGNGDKDRSKVSAPSVAGPLAAHLARVRRLHEGLGQGLWFGGPALPICLKVGCDIRTVRELLGHSGLSTTMITTHVLAQGPGAVRSPLELLSPVGVLPG